MLVYLGGHDSYALHLALQHPAHAYCHPRGIIVRRTDKDFVTMMNRNILKAFDQLRGKCICDIRYDQAEDPAPSGNQRARLRVRKVPQLLHCLQGALGGLGVNHGRVVDCMRYSGSRDSGAPCNLLDLHTLPSFPTNSARGAMTVVPLYAGTRHASEKPPRPNLQPRSKLSRILGEPLSAGPIAKLGPPGPSLRPARLRRPASRVRAGSGNFPRAVVCHHLSVPRVLIKCGHYWESVASFVEESSRNQRAGHSRLPPKHAFSEAIRSFLHNAI